MSSSSSPPLSPASVVAAASPNVGGGLLLNREGLHVATQDQTDTFRSFYKTYNTLSELCFKDCVWDFGTDVIRNRENRCIAKCTTSYLQTTKEIGARFAETSSASSSSASAGSEN